MLRDARRCEPLPGVVVLRTKVRIQQRCVWILRTCVGQVTVPLIPSHRRLPAPDAPSPRRNLAAPHARGVGEVMPRALIRPELPWLPSKASSECFDPADMRAAELA